MKLTESITLEVSSRGAALEARLRSLVSAKTTKSRRNLDLQELTGIPTSKWSAWWARRAKPSSDMLAELCHQWPDEAYWLMTGLGHSNSVYLPPEDEDHIDSLPQFSKSRENGTKT